jgi:hypothetical protein
LEAANYSPGNSIGQGTADHLTYIAAQVDLGGDA